MRGGNKRGDGAGNINIGNITTDRMRPDAGQIVNSAGPRLVCNICAVTCKWKKEIVVDEYTTRGFLVLMF